MKRITLLLLVFLVISASLHANPIDRETAKNIGAKFLKTSTEMKNVEVNDLKFVTAYTMNDGNEAFYVFNTESGFVIVAADDCATPILGYSTEGQFITDNLPIQMTEYLYDFVEQIEYGIAHETFRDAKTIKQWELVKSTGRTSENRDTKTVGPLLSTTWGQSPNYNAKCPSNNNGQAITGCVATAMGQIMKYHNYPDQGQGSHNYTHDVYGTLSVDFSATTYDWANMPNALPTTTVTPTTTQIDAVATLLYHCGVAVDMDYGPSSSGANSLKVPGVLQDYFKYSNDLSYDYRQYHCNEIWLNRVKSSIDEHYPVYYTGHDLTKGGHAFVCDGYDANDLLHFNWGWRGNNNNYFAIDALNVSGYKFNYANLAIFNIHPNNQPTISHTMNVSSSNTDHGTVSGGGSFTNGTNVTVTATPNTGYTFLYWTESGIIVSVDTEYTFKAEYSRTLVAQFAETVPMCGVVFDFQDTYGDGWQTNMLVVTYGDGFKEYMTLDDGHQGAFPRKIEDGGTIKLTWVEGFYTEETQFFIKNADKKIIYENTSPSSSLNYDLTVSSASEGEVKYYFNGASSAQWSNADNWICGSAPTATSAVSIKNNAILDESATIASLSLDRFDTLFINSGAVLTVTGSITQANRAMIVIEDGGQLIQHNSNIRAIAKKNVIEWATTPSVNGWHAISSPINAVAFDSIINLRSSAYNVYRYNEATTTWENCQNELNSFSSLENGRGYIYRKGDDESVFYKGKLNVSDVEYQLSYTADAGDLAGFHLIGNPYSHNIKKGVEISNDYLEIGFYSLESDGTWKAGTDNVTDITPCQAILVQAKNTVTDEKVVISQTTAKIDQDDYNYISLSVSSSNYSDVAYAIFNGGNHGLNKIDHRNDAIQKVFIHYNDDDFAVAEMNDETRMFDLYFKAQTTGNYTLHVDYHGDFSYLHVIDRLTGDDVDMLLEGSYSFVGAPNDAENRFIVKLNYKSGLDSSESSTFVYQSGNDIIVNGSGLLEVYDALGRLVSHQQITNYQSFEKSDLPNSIYIFRLTDDTVRTQKVVLQ